MARIQELIDAAKKDAENETEFKREVFLASLLKRMLNDSVVQDIKLARTAELPAKKKQSIKEFILQKKPKSDVEKVLVMGYFLEKQESFKCFNADDIRNAYVTSKESIPDNINDKINLNIKKGLITEYPEKKENKKTYHLTSTGEQVVENWSQNE